MNRFRRIPALLAVLLASTGTALAADGGSLLKAEDLKAAPFRDARTVESLAAGERVEILRTHGGWFQVKTARRSGWVRMLSVRRGEPRKGGADAAGILGLASGRAGTGRVVATTGIRGLTEEELKAATYSEAELREVESYSATRAEATQFAAKGKLVARQVEYLPPPDPAR